MKKFLPILFVLIAVNAFSQLCTPPSGIGCDVPTSVVCTPSGSDATKASCTWNTTLSSDSRITIFDQQNNATQTIYNGTMATCSAGVCPHSINLVNLAYTPSTGSVVLRYSADSCTHATFGNIGTECPNASPDWSSTGPATRAPGSLPSFKSIVRPAGNMSSWYSVPQPNVLTLVFPGDEFFINNKQAVGIGTLGSSGTPSTNVNYLLMHDVTIDLPGGGTSNCGFTNTQTPPKATYQAYGDSTHLIPCLGGSASADFILSPMESNAWVVGGPNSLNVAGLASANTTLTTAGQAGYSWIGWTGGDEQVYVKVGPSVPTGNYVIHYHLQPLLWDGTGNETGGSLVGQDKTISVAITVVALTPLAKSAPSSFPPWTFQAQFMAMAAYWGTWACSNSSDIRAGTGPMALYYNSGAFENVNFSALTWGGYPWNYDGTRNYLALGDRLFNTAHPDWASGHTYTIGDIITDTVSGKTFIMNAVNGAANPTLTGVSGGSRPPFNLNTSGGAVTPDNTLQWMSVVDANYWRGCALKAGDGYRNNILDQQATVNQEFTMFPSGQLMSFYRTGDASPGDESGFNYREGDCRFGGVDGSCTNPWTAISGGFGVANSCLYATDNLLQETGTSTYWTGGQRLSLCYASSLKAQFGPNSNSNNIGAGRPRALQLQEQVAYWMVKNDPAWIATDDGLRTQRMVNSSLAFLDMFQNLPASSLVNINTGSSGSISPTYMTGQNAEALIHYYQAQIYYSTGAFSGSGIIPDERIPIAIKAYADWMWTKLYDVEYDKNQTVIDGCFGSFPSICQGSRRLHSDAFPYDRWELNDYLSTRTFWTESASNAEIAVYSWLWAYNSTLVPPNNGRIAVTSYRDIELRLLQHAYDGRNCPGISGTTPGTCTSWGVADYYNGGRGSNSGYNVIVTSNKTIQQTSVNAVSESIPWLTGELTYAKGVMSPSTNPCWIVANRNADGSCNAPSPFPDVMAPYTWNFYTTTGRPGVSPQTICRPGGVGNQLTGTCLADQKFGSNLAPMNIKSYPGGTVSNTYAIFNFMTVENASCSLALGTDVLESSATVYPEAPAHTPSLVGGTPLPLWYHTIQATSLIPNTTYHFGIKCTDGAGNIAAYPYQLGAPGPDGNPVFQMSGAAQNQAATIQTTLLPTGADTITWPGIIKSPGTSTK